MADIKSPESPSKLCEELSKLNANIFLTEKNLIRLQAGLPVEKQETYTKQIQFLSKKRIALSSSPDSQNFSKDSLNSFTSLQEEYLSVQLSMISEIVEENEKIDYNESETAGKTLLRRQNTKGMITGDFNRALENTEKVLTIGESLIVQGYQKLFIDDFSMKEKLQAVIDDRRNLPVGNKPMETLIVKQEFLERQLTCLLALFDEANTLSDLISKLQEFDKRQIQFQKASQVTVDAFKKFLYKPDVRKSSERRRTYLSVSYAKPDNTREGLDILKDQVSSIIRNINLLTDMEDAKVRAINKSDLGDQCEAFWEEYKEIVKEETSTLQEVLDILVPQDEDFEDRDKIENLLEKIEEIPEKPQNQLETVRVFVALALNQPRLRLELAQTFKEIIEKYEDRVAKSSSLADKLRAEVTNLTRDNNLLRTQVQTSVIDKISEGKHSLKELFDYQELQKKQLTFALENKLKAKMTEVAMVASGSVEVLLGINPNEELKIRTLEYEADFHKVESLEDLLEVLSRYQNVIFRLVCRLGLVTEGHIHANLTNLKKANSLREARESLVGKPTEYPLSTMDKTLTEILKNYLESLEEGRGSIEGVIRKQKVLGRIFRDIKN
jgi:hypothetical protein